MKKDILAFKNFNDFWLDRVRQFGDQPCLIDGERSGNAYSYRGLNERIDQTAVLLANFGLATGWNSFFSTWLR